LGSLLIKSSIELVELAVDQRVDQLVDYVELFGSLEPSQNTTKVDKIPLRTDPRKAAYTMQESGNPTPMSASYYNAHMSIYLTFMIVPLAGSS